MIATKKAGAPNFPPLSNALTTGCPTSQNSSGGIGGPAIAKVKIRIISTLERRLSGRPLSFWHIITIGTTAGNFRIGSMLQASHEKP